MKIKTLVTLALLLLTASRESSAGDDKYVIGREDVLVVAVWQSPELSKTVTVEQDGSIDYGFLGAVPAAGMSPDQLRDDLAKKLASGYVKDPKVDVSVKEYNSKKILVFGEVEKPGLYRLKKEAPLLELFFLVGGVKPDAKRLTVIRPTEQGDSPMPAALNPEDMASDESDAEHTVREVDLIALLSKGDLSQNIMVYPGDTIYVASGTGEKFYVLGQVNSPGPIEWTGEITVLEAIKLAEGPTDQAALNRIIVRKNHGARQEEIRVNMTEIMRGTKKDDVLIAPDTVIIVPRSWV